MNDLFFVPSDWDIDMDSHSTVAAITKVPGYDNHKVSGWQMGDWWYNWSTIYSDFHLVPGENYCFHFWLNGGENDRHDEVCELEIFGEDWNARQTFSLNRNHTKCEKYVNGWYLFSISFVAPDEFVTLRFNVQRAIATIIPATEDDLTLAKNLRSDEEDITKPQRKNVVFDKGWPEEEDSLFPMKLCIGKKDLEITKTALIVAGIVIAAVALILVLVHSKNDD